MYCSESKCLTVSQLSKDEESSTPDAEVTREDQDKINAFSRLHNREKKYEEELEHKQVRFLPEFGRSIGRTLMQSSSRRRRKTSKRSPQNLN